MSMELQRTRYRGNFQKQVDFNKLRNPIINAKDDFAVDVHIMNQENNQQSGTSQQTKWDTIVIANHLAAKEELGYTTKKRGNPEIAQLSEKQKPLGILATPRKMHKRKLKSTNNKTK